MKRLVKNTVIPLIATLGAVQGAYAETESVKSLADQFDIHGVLTLSSDYRSRGFTKSDHHPSVQGGIALTHSSGAYLMLWGASATTPNGGSVEADAILGYLWKLNENSSLDFFYADVNYPGGTGQSPDFGEYGVMYKQNNAFLKDDNVSLAVYYSPNYMFDSGKEFYYWGEYSTPIFKNIRGFGALGYTKQDSVEDFNLGTAPGTDQKGYFDYKAGVRIDYKGVTTELAWVDNSIDSDLKMFEGRFYVSVTKQF